MKEFQSTFDEVIKDSVRKLALPVIEKKLIAAGIKNAALIAKNLLEHDFNKKDASFTWDDGEESEKTIDISLSDEEMAEIEQGLEKLSKSFPDLMQSVAEEAAGTMLQTKLQDWKHLYQDDVTEKRAFYSRLEERWGEALGLLRMLLHFSREVGAEVVKEFPPENSHLDNVLIRLHIRACQVTDEIITLMENGFADGAMARWRTLHEITVVMAIIREFGEAIAERYLDHQYVEAKSGKDRFLACQEKLGYEPIPEEKCIEIDKAFDAVKAKHGKDFEGPYGWAEGFVPRDGKRRIQFGELELAAGRAMMGSHYKLASHNVHAGPNALFFRLGLLDHFGFLSGASNAGLEEPGQNAANTLVLASCILLMRDTVNLDILVWMYIFRMLGDRIPNAFVYVSRELKADHENNFLKKSD